jgi:DnaK suppressor protein
MSTRLQATPTPHTHVSPAQLARLRRLLTEEHASQQARAVELQDAPDLEPSLAEVLLVRCREALEEIEEALRLIDEGGFGLCSVCGSAIPYERLEAVPAARRCVSCQAGHQETIR